MEIQNSADETEGDSIIPEPDDDFEPKIASPGCHTDLMPSHNDFFLPASKKRRIQKRPETEDMLIFGCKEVGNVSSLVLNPRRRREEKAAQTDCFKPQIRKQKQTANREAVECTSSMKPEIREKSSLFQFDLRMEAKLAAKETAQLCGGRPTHPFFSQQKSAQRTSISAGVTANLSSQLPVSEVGELPPAPPFHVTQLRDAEEYSKDDCSYSTGLLVEKSVVQSVHKRNSVNLNSKITLRLLRPCASGEPTTERMGKRPQRPPPDDALQPLLNFLKSHEDDGRDEETKEDDEKYSRIFLEKRIKSFSSRERRGILSEKMCCDIEITSPALNMLWIDVYQPQSPEEVCGNKEMITKLDAWLQRWKVRSASSERDNTLSNNNDFSEDHGWFEDDANDEINIAENDALQNVMFLTGPVGCGKTTAIYACAKAHGFTVIEVNCSDNRSGILIKQKFSEAMGSHRLGNWSAEMTGVNTVLSSRSEIVSSSRDNFSSQRNASKQGKRVIRKGYENSASNHGMDKLQLSTHAEDQVAMLLENEKSMTILLFEDVNMVFEDDRGFIAAVAQVAATAKRPIILTSNDKEFALPHNLGAQMLEFKKPSTKELVVLAYLICIAEGVTCNPECLEQIVKVCHHDVRELLNYLQFWCQGQHITMFNDTEGDKRNSITNELRPNVEVQEVDMGTVIALFNLEGQHRLWPAYLPISFPCAVTKSIASRLNSMLSEVEDRFNSSEREQLEQRFVKKRVFVKKMAKRNAVIELEEANKMEDTTEKSCHLVETPVKNLKEAKTVARSPILREKIKRKLAIVMADSDDEDDKNHYHHNMLQTTIDENRRSNIEIDVLPSTTVLVSESSMSVNGCSYSLDGSSVVFEDVSVHYESNRTNSNVWSELCNSREEHDHSSAVSKEALPIVVSISSLSDILSACDIMSSVHNGLQTGDMLVSNDGLLQSAAHLAHYALKLCIQECREAPICAENVKGTEFMEDMMLIWVNDPSALGGVATMGGILPHIRIPSEVVTPPSIDQDLKRLENRSSIQHDLCYELPSKAQRSFQGGLFFESASFLSRMIQLEQERSTFCLANRRRGRGKGHFSFHPWNLSQRSIGALQRFGTFSKSDS